MVAVRRLIPLLALSIAGCAGTPTSPPVVAGTAGGAAAIATDATAAAAAAADPTMANRQKLLAQAKSQGYRPETQNGATVYCIEHTDIGTHIAKKDCLSEDSVVAQMDRDQKNRESWATSRLNCGGPQCSGVKSSSQ